MASGKEGEELLSEADVVVPHVGKPFVIETVHAGIGKDILALRLLVEEPDNVYKRRRDRRHP